jgi:Undecaprenyl-phosphate glucose phosphotransferase
MPSAWLDRSATNWGSHTTRPLYRLAHFFSGVALPGSSGSIDRVLQTYNLADDMTLEDIRTAGGEGTESETRNFYGLGRTGIVVAQMVGDGLIVVALSGISLFAATFPINSLTPNRILLYCMVTGVTPIIAINRFARSGVYDVFDAPRFLLGLSSTIKGLFKVLLLVTAGLFAWKLSDNISRLWLVFWGSSSVVGLCAFRILTQSVVRRLKESGELTKNVAIVAASEIGHELAVKLARAGIGIRLVGIYEERRSRFVQSPSGSPPIRPLPALYELLCRGCVDEIVIAIPPYASRRILEISRRFHPFPVTLRVLAPDGYENFQVLDSRRYGNIGTFRVMSKPLDEVAALIKRVEDVMVASSCLLFLLPLMLLIALAIKLDSPGPVLFRQKRLGINNLPFDLFKFRTMYVEQTDPFGHQLTRAGDPRITRVGRFLRRTSMDELPQLINVLKGEMSVVGPRPHALAASAAGVSYARAIIDYPIRHRVKPGITGWAQVNGWRGETTTIEQIRRRVEHDLYYIENWSLSFDFLILGRTVLAVLSRANAI